MKPANILTVESSEIKAQWKEWADTYEMDLRATTKTSTIKQLEVHALAGAMRPAIAGKNALVLEVGCGNGINCLTLAEIFPNSTFVGIDYVPEMIRNAERNLDERPELSDRVSFLVGDVLNIGTNESLSPSYDVVFTDRMLINLNTWELQAQALDHLIEKVSPGGYLLVLENFVDAHRQLNNLRSAVGLEHRPTASFNLFIYEGLMEGHLERKATLQTVEAFGSLHDVILYVLTPLVGNGDIDYDHPFVQAATRLCLSADGFSQGESGQNRLYVFRRHQTVE